MNERIHLFVKLYISHTLFSKGLMFLWCVRDGWRQGQTAILTQLLLLTISRCVIFKNPLSTSSASWLGLSQPGVAECNSPQRGVLSLQAGWPSCVHLTQRPAEGCCRQWPPIKQPQPKHERSAKWVLEDNTACYGQEKKLGQYSSLSLSPLFSHMPQKHQIFQE